MRRFSYLYILGLLFFFSCDQEKNSSLGSKNNQSDSFDVTLSSDSDSSVDPESADPETTQSSEGEITYSFLRNEASKELTESEVNFILNMHDFAWNFLERLVVKEMGSIIFSPLSLTFLQGMLSEGADGETLRELLSCFDVQPQDIHAISEFCLNLRVIVEEIDPSVELSFANALIIDKGFSINESYIKCAKEYYDANVKNLDFSKESETLNYINTWVYNYTEGMIGGVLPKIDPKAYVYLLNALYFNAEWSEQFSEEETYENCFVMEDGNSVNIECTHRIISL